MVNFPQNFETNFLLPFSRKEIFKLKARRSEGIVFPLWGRGEFAQRGSRCSVCSLENEALWLAIFNLEQLFNILFLRKMAKDLRIPWGMYHCYRGVWDTQYIALDLPLFISDYIIYYLVSVFIIWLVLLYLFI